MGSGRCGRRWTHPNDINCSDVAWERLFVVQLLVCAGLDRASWETTCEVACMLCWWPAFVLLVYIKSTIYHVVAALFLRSSDMRFHR